MSRMTWSNLILGAFSVALPTAIMADSGFEGRVGFGFEVERKTCTSCSPSEYDNEIEISVLELVLRPRSRPNLSYGLQLEYETEAEGAFLGSGRIDTKNNTALDLWVRKDFENGFWARAQIAGETEEGSLDLGGRIGYGFDITEKIDISGYLNLERRFPIGSASSARRGTYLEAGAEIEWDGSNRGAWAEFELSKWYFDSSTVADEQELIIQPGIWAEIGDTDHRGLLWLEFEHEKISGARQKEEYSSELGIGVEFELPKRSELMIGITVGREREEEPGKPDERDTVYGLELAFQRRF